MNIAERWGILKRDVQASSWKCWHNFFNPSQDLFMRKLFERWHGDHPGNTEVNPDQVELLNKLWNENSINQIYPIFKNNFLSDYIL